MNYPRIATTAASCAFAALSPSLGNAQQAEGWKWQATAYVYLPDIGGSTTFPESGSGSGLALDASTILDNLKMTFMGSIEARNARWGLFTDAVYLNLGNTKSGFREFNLGGRPLPGGVNANLGYDLKGWSWTLGALWPISEGASSRADFLAGARLFDLRQTVEWELTGDIGPIPLPGRSGSSRATLSNWDAIIGLKGRMAFGEGRRWFAPYYLDIGAGESKFTWQAMAGIGYSFPWGDAVAAWRYMDYEMKSGGGIETMDFNGPALAAVFRW